MSMFCLCFDHHGYFKKLMKIFFSLLKKLCVRIIIYPDDMLLMVASQEELLIPRDTLIFLLKQLGFLNSTPTSILEFLQCVKSVQIRSYFWSVFSRIRNEYGYFVSLRIQSECGKIRTRNNSVFGHFSRSATHRKEQLQS